MAMQEWTRVAQWAQLARDYRARAQQWEQDGFHASARVLMKRARMFERWTRQRADALLTP